VRLLGAPWRPATWAGSGAGCERRQYRHPLLERVVPRACWRAAGSDPAGGPHDYPGSWAASPPSWGAGGQHPPPSRPPARELPLDTPGWNSTGDRARTRWAVLAALGLPATGWRRSPENGFQFQFRFAVERVRVAPLPYSKFIAAMPALHDYNEIPMERPLDFITLKSNFSGPFIYHLNSVKR